MPGVHRTNRSVRRKSKMTPQAAGLCHKHNWLPSMSVQALLVLRRCLSTELPIIVCTFIFYTF